jgi:hypothetical protein
MLSLVHCDYTYVAAGFGFKYSAYTSLGSTSIQFVNEGRKKNIC